MNDPIETFLLLLAGLWPILFFLFLGIAAGTGKPQKRSLRKTPQPRALGTTSHPTTERGTTSDLNGGGYDGGGYDGGF